MITSRLKILLILSFLFQNIYCDVIPDNSHYVEKCVKITNIADYENLTLLGYVWHWGSVSTDPDHEYTYEISPSTCLSVGYHLNSMDVFAVNTKYLTGKDMNELDLPNDAHAIKSNLEIYPYCGYVDDSIPMIEINEFYQIIGFTDTSVVLHMWKEIIKYNNGSGDSVKIYEYEGDISSLKQEAPAGLKDMDASSENIHVYPNPAEKYFNTDITNNFIGAVEIRLFSSNGSLLFSTTMFKNTEEVSTKIPFDNYAPGVYFLRIRFGDANETRRIIIK